MRRDSARSDAVDKLRAREEQLRAKALDRMEAYTGSSAGARGGSFKSKFQKRKRVNTNKVVYDDPATHSCLCCEEYETDCEPAYPCEDFQDIDMWGNGDSDVDDDSQVRCIPCERTPGQRYRLPCDDDRCVNQAHEGGVPSLRWPYIIHTLLSATLLEFNTLLKCFLMTTILCVNMLA
jgi:hypothetical protein